MSTPQSDAPLAAVRRDHSIRRPAARRLRHPAGHHQPAHRRAAGPRSSKYALVIYAAKRARQINDYYNQLGEGILEYVGPLVEPGLQEKPLSIALREIHADLLEHTEGE